MASKHMLRASGAWLSRSEERARLGARLTGGEVMGAVGKSVEWWDRLSNDQDVNGSAGGGVYKSR